MSKITIEDQVWNCNDPRLPLNKDLDGPPPTDRMIQTIREIQLQPIGMATRGQEWKLVWGNRRLKAIRLNFESGQHTGDVRVSIIRGVPLEDTARLSLMENSVRSSNEIQAYSMLHRMLKEAMKNQADLNKVYQEVAAGTGYLTTEIQAIERKWCKVPVWAVNAAERGDIALSVAMAVGKLSPSLQEECKGEFKADKKLSLSTVQNKKRLLQYGIYTGMQDGLGLNTTEPRQSYPREELDAVHSLLVTERYDDAKKYLEVLLAQVE